MRSPAKTKRAQRQPVSARTPYATPYRGLNTRDPENSMRPGYATGLINWWPNGLQVETRPGRAEHVTGFVSPVKALGSWEGSGGTRSLWAFCDDGIFNASVAGAVGAAAHVRTNGEARIVSFRNSANTFLFAANGVDSLCYYNGTVWTDIASFTITGGGTLTTTDIVSLEVHQRRLWFVEKDSTDAYYLGVDLIGGDATLFPLGAQFSKGGYLQAISTWSVDGGQGPEDYCAFISSRGQVAVYAGTDPNSVATWGLKGIFNLSEPIGYKCVAKIGRECQILTKGGVFPLSGILTGNADTEELAITDAIRPTITSAARSHGDKIGWQFGTLLAENLLLVNVPTAEFATAYQFAMNTVTKAWTIFQGWNALCWEQHGSGLYFGGTTSVSVAWTTYADAGVAITALARGHFDALGRPGSEKHWKLVRPACSFTGNAQLALGLDVDYKVDLAYGAAPAQTNVSYVWDDPASDWNTATWAALQGISSEWLEYPAWPGTVVAVRLRSISSAGKVRWSATDFIYETGGIF